MMQKAGSSTQSPQLTPAAAPLPPLRAIFTLLRRVPAPGRAQLGPCGTLTGFPVFLGTPDPTQELRLKILGSWSSG